ncbi:TonB-dependent receptor plug domain-containing protein [Bowmanella pacifica]|uniref:TonB-dependent receptor n=1 Tax=Bowmanella pacifica TaxID=502051 RepID=A0A917YXG0_9ALTE|nr:TonB-dependent receptor [Bowmanella pacifica]GGO69629.1 TonB-dependent receptor [Bowmanella pacifica]
MHISTLATHVGRLLGSGLLSVPLLALGSQTAVAQEGANEQNEQLEQIIVTGTRRSDRTVAQSNVPIDILDADQLTSSGQLEVSQLLTNLAPSFNYPHATVTDGTDHARPAVLRGLAPDHTLVLINGKRRHAGALLNLNGSVGRGSSAVDMNMIPAASIKRIEILRDGAASQYGSDAIAGVINIVLKDSAEDGAVTLTYGQHETQMAGVPQLTGVSDNGNGGLAFSTGEDRKRSDGETWNLSVNKGFNLNDEGFINLTYEYRDREPTNRSGFDPRRQYALQTDGSFDPREFDIDRYNHRFGKAALEEHSLIANGGYSLGDVELYGYASYGLRDGESGGFYRRASDSRNVPAIYPDGFLPYIVSDIEDFGGTFGAKGLAGEWQWDASLTHGWDSFNFNVENSLNTSLGADSPTRFDAGTLEYTQSLLNLDFSRYYTPNWLPDSLLVAVGAEYRKENYEIKAGEEASYLTVLDSNGNPVAAGGSQVFPGFSPLSATDRSRHNWSLYVDLDTNLTERWNIALATRFEDYSDFGSDLSGKLASRYQLTDGLAVRGSVSNGFRAPSLAQSAFTTVSTQFVNGVPFEVGTYTADHPAAIALGSQPLQEEQSLSRSVGVTYQAGNLSLTLDWYRIDIDDRIVLSESLSGPEVIQILNAAGINGVQQVRYFTNAIDTRTRGVDVTASYNLPLADYGSLNLTAAYNRNDTEVERIAPNPPQLDALDPEQYTLFGRLETTRFEEGTPDSKLNLAATWQYDRTKVTLRAVRYGEVVDAGSTEANDEVLDAKWITDIDVAYELTDNWQVAVGANNLFDQYPRDTISTRGQTDFNQIFPYSGFSAYSIDGRYWYAKATYRF